MPTWTSPAGVSSVAGRQFTAELDVPFDSAGQWQDIVRQWCPRIAEYAEPDWIEVARSSSFVSPLGTADPEDPLGPPGETYGYYRIGGRGYPFGLDVLGRRDIRRRMGLRLELHRLDENGWLGNQWLSFTAERNHVDTGNARLRGNADLSADPLRTARWVAAWKHFAGQLPCVFGHISEYDYSMQRRTRQETRAKASPVLSPPTASGRGLGWATVVRLEEISGAPGVDALKASGCFHEVDPVGEDRCWLQITPSIETYSEEAYQKAADAFAAVLHQSTRVVNGHG